jgi:FkbM family methyltransferase
MIAHLRQRLMEWIAAWYPTAAMDRRPLLAAIWRLLFYALGPEWPFHLRTRYYDLWAVPRRDHCSRAVLRRGYWERYETEVFRAQLRPGMLVADVGANFGHYSLVAAREIGSDGLVLACEPQPPVRADLERNVALNRAGNIRVLPYAIGERDGSTAFVVDAYNVGGSSRSVANVTVVGAQYEVPLRRLATVLAEQCPDRRLGLLKMDVQGGEASVLDGAWEIIERDRPVVMLEFWPDGLRRAGADPVAVLNRFGALGYALRLVQEREQRLLPIDNAIDTWPGYNLGPGWQVNLLLVPLP